jgi:hypothetical protein
MKNSYGWSRSFGQQLIARPADGWSITVTAKKNFFIFFFQNPGFMMTTKPFHSMGYVGYFGSWSIGVPYPLLVTFEPGTLNLETVTLN